MEVFHVMLSFRQFWILTAWRKKLLQNLAVLLQMLLSRLPEGRTVRWLWEGSLKMAEALRAQRLWKTSCMGRREMPKNLSSVLTLESGGVVVPSWSWWWCGGTR